MSELREIVIKDRDRKWFSSPEEDLYLYLDEDGGIESIEFCYGKNTDEHVLIIRSGNQNSHMRVDDGEQELISHKESPIYVLNGSYSLDHIISNLAAGIGDLSESERNDIIAFVRDNTRHE